ncbi:unnamed protein product, partial [Dibothriocephalus latus]
MHSFSPLRYCFLLPKNGVMSFPAQGSWASVSGHLRAGLSALYDSTLPAQVHLSRWNRALAWAQAYLHGLKLLFFRLPRFLWRRRHRLATGKKA